MNSRLLSLIILVYQYNCKTKLFIIMILISQQNQYFGHVLLNLIKKVNNLMNNHDYRSFTFSGCW